MILGKICAAAAVLCLAYYLLIVLYAGITADFAWIWTAFALVFAGVWQVLRFAGRHPGAIWPVLFGAAGILAALGAAAFLYLAWHIAAGMRARPGEDLDYVIVLGAQVKGEAPSRALKKRLDRALAYAEEHPDTKLVLSGGQGGGEEITEAECMYRYLADGGISPKRLLLEDCSASTRENLEFSDELYHTAGARTGILSNDFHICRALLLARSCGYTDVCGIPAPSDPVMQPHYIVREAAALVVLGFSQGLRL